MMKRYYFIQLLILCVVAAFGTCISVFSVTKDDRDLPLSPNGTPEIILHRTGYTSSYNKDTKQPNWVAWHLTAEHSSGPCQRPTNAWHEDEDVPVPRATLADYKGSGWSRGHLCPAGDSKWSRDAMYESFLFTNCCPQNANLNSGAWNQIEMACRRWAEHYGDIYIVCGPILYNKEHETIGPNKVVVPEAFFKVILCLNGKPKGIGFIRKNTDSNKRNELYVNTITEVERITGITFFPTLSKNISEIIKSKADIKDWE